MKRLVAIGLVLALGGIAQAQEVVVTGSRIARPTTGADTAGIGIRRRADFAVQVVTVYGDAREKEQRRREILATVRNAIELGGRQRIQLAYGDTVIQPLTLANYAAKLRFEKDEDRDDAERVTFVVKTPLTDGDAPAAFDRLTRFADAVSLVGRAVLEHDAEPGVSIVDPSQYRPQIVAAIAADATAAARAFGPEYAVQVGDLARPVRWAPTGPTEVLLYIEHDLTVVPKK